MKTEYRLAEALKEMMAQVPLDSISVTTLAKKCHVNRQTFYYHFHDIYDLLTLVFLNEEVPGLWEATNIKEMLELIYKYYTKNKAFIDATLNSAGKNLVEEFIQNSCYKTFMRFIATIPESKKLHINDKKSIARFYSLAYSHSIIYYISTYKNKSLEGLNNCFTFENSNPFPDAIERTLIIRSKQK